MERNKYFEVADRLYNEGKIDEEVYQAMIFNADEFCDDDDCDDYRLPRTYAEIECKPCKNMGSKSCVGVGFV